jgi:hypothetical protein
MISTHEAYVTISYMHTSILKVLSVVLAFARMLSARRVFASTSLQAFIEYTGLDLHTRAYNLAT